MFFYIEILAGGEIEGLDDHLFNFSTASVDLGACQTDIDVLRALTRGIRRAFPEADLVTEKGKNFLKWLQNWELMGVKYNEGAEPYDFQDLTDELVYQVSAVLSDNECEKDGLLILIDEADRPSEIAQLGLFVKLFTERLTKLRCNKVVLGLAGLPITLNRLKNSHESAPRIFHTMLLEPLEYDERKSVLRIGLKEANRINEVETKITKDAEHLIASLSEGYPHFVQQFCYSAFETDTDGHIDVDDVVKGAFDENGAIQQLGNKYFDEMYHGKIWSDDYRLVLDTMAQHGDNWVTRKMLIEQSELKDSTVSNALSALKTRNIIIADETRQGNYRLPTKSFAAWINAIKSVEERKHDGLTLFASQRANGSD